MDKFAEIVSAAHSGAAGINGFAPPTAEQARSGNYRKGRVDLYGLKIAIETPAGQRRTGKEDGKPWSVICMAHYGEISGTRGKDGDPLDVFIGPWPETDKVWVINRVNQRGEFDEHKIMLAFPSEEAAVTAYTNSYESGAAGIGSVVPCTVEQLKWWIKFGDTTKPLTRQVLPYDGSSDMNEMSWDSAGNPVGRKMADIIYNIRREDRDNLMLDAVTVADIIEDSDGEMVLDALVVPLNKLERKMQQLQVIMRAAGDKVKPVALQVTNPFRQRGTTNVAAVFELSDGQTISIFFHNPDTTPNKLTPDDEMVSWKWMLNKKDVTILVAPERGKDLNPREVARRVMRLAEANSARFAQVNAKKAERMQAIEALRAEVQNKEAVLAELNTQIADLTEKVEKKRRTGAPDPGRQDGSTVDPVKPKAAVVEQQSDFDPTTPEGYWKIFSGGGNEALALEHQDQLDHLFQGRLIAVRNALRERGWDGEQYKALSKNGNTLVTDFWQVGAGKNIAGIVYKVTGPSTTAGAADGVRDDLSLTPEELAAEIDAFVAKTPAKPDIAIGGSKAEKAWNAAREADGSLNAVSDLAEIRKFLSDVQFKTLARLAQYGEERKHFQQVVEELAQRIANMPKTYEQDGKGDAAVAYLHYFKGGADWYITEKDVEDGVTQAFGLADLGQGFPEIGYISITELVQNGAELDLHWTPRTLGAIKNPPRPSVNRKAEDAWDAQAGEPLLTRYWNAIGALYGGPGNMPEHVSSMVRVFADELYWGKFPEDGDFNAAVERIRTITRKWIETTNNLQPPDFAISGTGSDIYRKAERRMLAESDSHFGPVSQRAGLESILERLLGMSDPLTLEFQTAITNGMRRFDAAAAEYRKIADKNLAEAEAAQEAAEQAKYSKFDESQIKMPTAAQLRMNILGATRTFTRDGVRGWTNGHLLDLTGIPKVAAGGFEKYVGGIEQAPVVPEASVEKVLSPVKSASIEIKPVAFYDDERQHLVSANAAQRGDRKGAYKRVKNNWVVFASDDEATVVLLDRAYAGYFMRVHKGAKFYASANASNPILVKKGGEIVGLVMPIRDDSQDRLIRARRAASQEQPQSEAAPTPDPELVNRLTEIAKAADGRISKLSSQMYFTVEIDGDDLIFGDELRAAVEAKLGEPLKEVVLPGLEGQVSLVPESYEVKPEQKELTVAEARAELDRLMKERDEYRRRMNEGGGGFNPYEEKVERAAAALTEARNRELLADAEGYRSRWNAAVNKYSKNGKLLASDLKKVEQEAGMTQMEAMWLGKTLKEREQSAAAQAAEGDASPSNTGADQPKPEPDLERAAAVRQALIGMGYSASGAGNMLIKRDGDRTVSVKSSDAGGDYEFLLTVLVKGEQVHDAQFPLDSEGSAEELAQRIAAEGNVGAAEDGAETETRAFLATVIDGSADMMDPDLADRLTKVADDFADNAEVMALFNQAAEAYSNYMVAEARKALSA